MIHNSLFTGNYASEHGGGMRIGGSGSFFKISNSSINNPSNGTGRLKTFYNPTEEEVEWMQELSKIEVL
mgnify:CR=1 FL=1